MHDLALPMLFRVACITNKRRCQRFFKDPAITSYSHIKLISFSYTPPEFLRVLATDLDRRIPKHIRKIKKGNNMTDEELRDTFFGERITLATTMPLMDGLATLIA